MESEIMNKKEAMELIAGLTKAEDRWKAFDKYITEQGNKATGISKKSVTKGLILEAMGHEVENYREETVNTVMKGLLPDESRYLDKRFKSIKSLVSQAYNKASKGSGTERKKRSKMTVNLPSSPDVDTDLNTFEGLKALLMYRLDQLKLGQLSEIEGIVKEKIRNSEEGGQLHELRKIAHEKEETIHVTR